MEEANIPSRFLPILRPPPTLTAVTQALHQLQDLYAPKQVVVDLTQQISVEVEGEGYAGYDDDFEISHARGWLERLLNIREKLGVEPQEGWDVAIELAASLLADMSGQCAAGERERCYILPTVREPESTLRLRVRDTTLLASSTGFRTWGASTVLAQRLALDPDAFFPPIKHSSGVSSAMDKGYLRVLELGSGTGLVGLTAAAVLRRLHRKAEVELTDFEGAVLNNLEHNLALNAVELNDARIFVKRLDWYDYLTDGNADNQESFDVILAADVVYEPAHVASVLSTVSHFLRLDPAACLHLVLPLRPTHVDVHSNFDSILGAAESTYARIDKNGVRWRLATRERHEAEGDDGFGGVGRAKGTKVDRYWVYRIGWERGWLTI